MLCGLPLVLNYEGALPAVRSPLRSTAALAGEGQAVSPALATDMETAGPEVAYPVEFMLARMRAFVPPTTQTRFGRRLTRSKLPSQPPLGWG